MSVLDDPRKTGQRYFCSEQIETTGGFMHREHVGRKYAELDDKSEQVSYFRDGCSSQSSCLDVDSVRGMAVQGTREMVDNMRAAEIEFLSVNSDEDLARSINVEDLDSSYELLSSRSSTRTVMARSALRSVRRRVSRSVASTELRSSRPSIQMEMESSMMRSSKRWLRQ